jgi:hypothetical protein
VNAWVLHVWGLLVLVGQIPRLGMGAIAATTPQLISTAGGVAGSTLAATIALWAPLIGVTGPVGLAIAGGVAAVTAILGALGVGSGCGSTCIQASNDANQIETQMRANLAAYQAGQIDGTTAVANFDQLWTGLENACNQIGGGAGQNCISDRQQGACKWRDSSGACWNWFIGYRDPIAIGSGGGSAASSINWTSLALLAGAGLLVAEVL